MSSKPINEDQMVDPYFIINQKYPYFIYFYLLSSKVDSTLNSIYYSINFF
jgi:hypothetical protein